MDNDAVDQWLKKVVWLGGNIYILCIDTCTFLYDQDAFLLANGSLYPVAAQTYNGVWLRHYEPVRK